MAGKRTFRLPRVQGIALWAPIAGLLGLGLLTTLIDLSSLPGKEAARANAARQRFVIDPVSGTVMLGDLNPRDAEEKFDVGTPQEASKPSESSAVDTPQTEQAPPTEPAAPDPIPEGAPVLRTAPLTSVIEEIPTRSKDSLVIAPAREVTEDVGGLQLPKRGDKDVIASKLYAHPFTRKPEQVLLSFVVMDAGIDPQAIGLLMNLPMEVTVAYSPYTRPSQSYSEHVRARGHEVWTMLPTMDANYPATDPGPLGIIATMPPEEITRRTQHVLAAIPGSIGVILPPNETIVAQKDGISHVLYELNKRGLLMLSTHPSRNIDQISNKPETADIIRRADLVLDTNLSESQIRSKLAGLLDAAKEKGEYVVMLSARPQSLELLRDWFKETPLPEPFVLAPLTAIYQPKEVVPVKEESAEGGHGGEKKEKPKPKPPEKKKKPLPQDKYLKPAGAKDGHGGGEKPSGGGH